MSNEPVFGNYCGRCRRAKTDCVCAKTGKPAVPASQETIDRFNQPRFKDLTKSKLKQKPKLYFRTIDDTFCKPIEGILEEAKLEGLSKITVLEAVPDTDNKDYVWCRHYGEVAEKSECSKSVCPYYESKSGRGKCSNKGKLYYHGEEVTFKIEKEAPNA